MGEPIYKRVVLKISGEAIAGKDGFGIDPATIKAIAEEIQQTNARSPVKTRNYCYAFK